MLPEGPAQDDPAAIRTALCRILDEPRFRAGAQRLAADMRAQPSPIEMVDVLERLSGAGLATAA